MVFNRIIREAKIEKNMQEMPKKIEEYYKVESFLLLIGLDLSRRQRLLIRITQRIDIVAVLCIVAPTSLCIFCV